MVIVRIGVRPSPSGCIYERKRITAWYQHMHVLGHYPDSQSVQVLADRLSKVADVTVQMMVCPNLYIFSPKYGLGSHPCHAPCV